MTIALAILFGVLVGLVLGSLGGGGSVLVVPALVYGLAVRPGEATTLSQAIVGSISLVAAMFHWKAGRVRVGTAFALAAFGMPGAYLGRVACQSASDTLIMMSLALVLIATSLLMLRKAAKDKNNGITSEGEQPNATIAALSQRPPRYLLLISLAGVSVGFLTGFLGVGGGFLILPVLVVVLRVPMKPAIGTSLVVITVNCASSLLWTDLTDVQWQLTFPFIGGALVSSVAAAHAVHSIDSTKLTRWFAWLVILIGVVILVERVRSLAGYGS